MAFSTQTAVGPVALLDLTIDYLDRAEISVYYDALPVVEGVDWEWSGTIDKRILFTPPVTTGVEVLVKRTTPLDNIRHEFSKGAAFTPETLDEDLKQVLHIAQEAAEGNLSGDFFADIDMHGNNVTNLGTAVNPGDAVPLSQVQAPLDAALDAAALAQAWAVSLSGPVEGIDYSARYYANQAQTYVASLPAVPFPINIGGTGANNQAQAQINLGLQPDVDVADITGTTGALRVPNGTTAERPPGESGMFRLNETLNRFEGYKAGAWGSVGGGATGGGADEVFVENGNTVTSNYTLTTGKNAEAVGPITVQSGVTVEVPTGQVLVIL